MSELTKKDLAKLMDKFSIKRVPTDRGRDIVYVRNDVFNVKPIITKKSTCAMHDNGGIGHVRKIKVGKITKLVCDECYAAIIRSKILYEI